jgi:hypothetical protein
MRSYDWYRKVIVITTLAAAASGMSGCRSSGTWSVPGAGWFSWNNTKTDVDALASKPSTTLPSPSSTVTPPGPTQTAANSRPGGAISDDSPSAYGPSAYGTNTGTGTGAMNYPSTPYGALPQTAHNTTGAYGAGGYNTGAYNTGGATAPAGANTYSAQGFYPNQYPGDGGVANNSAPRGNTYSTGDFEGGYRTADAGGAYGATGTFGGGTIHGGNATTHPNGGNFDNGGYPHGYAPPTSATTPYRPGSTRDGDDEALNSGVQPANYSDGQGWNLGAANYPSGYAPSNYGSQPWSSTGAQPTTPQSNMVAPPSNFGGAYPDYR